MEDENTRLNEEVAAAMGFSKFGAQKKGNPFGLDHAHRSENLPIATDEPGSAFSSTTTDTSTGERLSKRAKLSDETAEMNPEASTFTLSEQQSSSTQNTSLPSRPQQEPQQQSPYELAGLVPASVLLSKPPTATSSTPLSPTTITTTSTRSAPTIESLNSQSHPRTFNPSAYRKQPPPDPNAIAWTAPSGKTYTHKELDDYASGRIRNERGDMVIFKPDFLEDPWKGLMEKIERRKKAEAEAEAAAAAEAS